MIKNKTHNESKDNTNSKSIKSLIINNNLTVDIKKHNKLQNKITLHKKRLMNNQLI